MIVGVGSKMSKNIEISYIEKNYIQGFIIDNLHVCDDLIEYFQNHPEKHIQGECGDPSTMGPAVKKEIKDSIDLFFMPDEDEKVWNIYKQELFSCIDEYTKIFPCSTETGHWGLVEFTNLQYYAPGGGYKVWHAERICSIPPYSNRHLVFMTYLNDVTIGGETEFLHQQLKVKPKKGLTLIWPADWTHMHRGIVSNTQKKYIITGWLSFIN